MNLTNLRCLLQIYVEAQLNHIDDRDYGIGQVPPALYPFLPNRPPIFEVLQLHPEFIEAFGRPEPTDCLNVRKSEVETDIPPLNLAPTQPGGSRDTTIEYLDADKPNPESCQNTPFENVVLPRHREDPLPDLVDLRQNPEDVPWEMYYPPQFDIPLERRYYICCSTGMSISIVFALLLLQQATLIVSGRYNLLAERAERFWLNVVMPTMRCEGCIRHGNRECKATKNKDGSISTAGCEECHRQHDCCSYGIILAIRLLAEWTIPRYPVSQDLFSLCRRWGLIVISSRTQTFSLAITKASKKSTRQSIRDTVIELNFNDYARHLAEDEAAKRGIWNA
ncbi:hypothetical protein PQX77_019179 [Marasmius sp. AFHP31]|nr:hypothetical protein PQX77_019179 [Marasmius sp. AFHP31]